MHMKREQRLLNIW